MLLFVVCCLLLLVGVCCVLFGNCVMFALRRWLNVLYCFSCVCWWLCVVMVWCVWCYVFRVSLLVNACC